MNPPALSRTLLRACLWLAVAFVGGTLGAFVVGFVCGLINSLQPGAIAQANLRGAAFAGALVVSALAFRWGALREARRSPDARLRASAAPGFVRRWPVALVAAGVLTPFAALLAASLERLAPQAQPASLATSPLLLALAALLVAVLTPYAEETFFRGWLWTALCLRSGVRTAAVLSGALFLFAHVTEALLRGEWQGAAARALILLPLAIGLSLVRALCGAPRAAMIVHGLYNFTAIAAPPLLRVGGFL